jgi:hypothetical protein
MSCQSQGLKLQLLVETLIQHITLELMALCTSSAILVPVDGCIHVMLYKSSGHGSKIYI